MMMLPILLAMPNSGSAGVESVAPSSTYPPSLSDIKSLPQLRAQKQRRTALVIGNGNYTAAGRLKNPAKDAADVAQVLRELGFEVTLIRDKSRREIFEAIEEFNRQLRKGGAGLFYFAGHGVQVNGQNYLIPIEANINREQDVQYEAVPLGRILGAMEDANNAVNIVLIDACRNNPYVRGWRSSTRGLAAPRSAKGTLISFAAGPGEVAADGDGQNSPYTASLLEHIRTPGVPVELVFKQVRQSVQEKTKQAQSPWEQSNLVGEFVFEPGKLTSTKPEKLTSTKPEKFTFKPFLPASPSPIPRPESPLTSTPQPSSPLISKATGYNYTSLRDLLTAGNWEGANNATKRAMRHAAGHRRPFFIKTLSSTDVKRLPCEDLGKIDKLWVAASNSKFGFSVQSEIYRRELIKGIFSKKNSQNDVWQNFYKNIGWRVPFRGLSFELKEPFGLPFKPKAWLIYDLKKAPRGHLPMPYCNVLSDQCNTLVWQDLSLQASKCGL